MQSSITTARSHSRTTPRYHSDSPQPTGSPDGSTGGLLATFVSRSAEVSMSSLTASGGAPLIPRPPPKGNSPPFSQLTYQLPSAELLQVSATCSVATPGGGCVARGEGSAAVQAARQLRAEVGASLTAMGLSPPPSGVGMGGEQGSPCMRSMLRWQLA